MQSPVFSQDTKISHLSRCLSVCAPRPWGRRGRGRRHYYDVNSNTKVNIHLLELPSSVKSDMYFTVGLRENKTWNYTKWMEENKLASERSSHWTLVTALSPTSRCLAEVNRLLAWEGRRKMCQRGWRHSSSWRQKRKGTAGTGLSITMWRETNPWGGGYGMRAHVSGCCYSWGG